MVAAVKGYRMLVVMPEGMSGERVAISRAFGAEVMEVGHFHVNEALAKAKELGQEPGYFCPAQFESEWNVEENRIWLGPEILAQLPDGVVPDALVMGVGTVGPSSASDRLSGRSTRRQALRHGALGVFDHPVRRGGDHLIEGISDGFVPGIFERHQGLVDTALTVDSQEAVAEMRRLARNHGLFVGPSSGANLIATRKRVLPRASEHRDSLLRRGRKVHKRSL